VPAVKAARRLLTCVSLATLIAVTPGLADPSIHTPHHADQLTPEWQRPSGVNAPLNTQQKVRRTQHPRSFMRQHLNSYYQQETGPKANVAQRPNSWEMSRVNAR
jgi:hypothetical protein